MKAKELEHLIFSPFHTSKILHHFLSGANSINENGIKAELINIILPIIYNEKFVNEFLSTLNKKSNLNSLILSYEFKKFASNINEEIKNFKLLTKNSLIVLSNEKSININEFIKINNSIDFHTETDNNLKKIYKSSYNLGIIIAKENYLSVFLKLKITEL